MSKEPYQSDAYPPVEIARKVERLGEAKAHTDTLTLLVLAMLAGPSFPWGRSSSRWWLPGTTLALG
jgi:hypothetical protein